MRLPRILLPMGCALRGLWAGPPFAISAYLPNITLLQYLLFNIKSCESTLERVIVTQMIVIRLILTFCLRDSVLLYMNYLLNRKGYTLFLFPPSLS